MSSRIRGVLHIAAHGLAALLTTLLLEAVEAREIHIAPTDDLAVLRKNVRPGDTFVLAEGEWRDVALVVEAEGTAETPVTIRAQTPGQTILTGRSRLRFSGSFITVEGLVFCNLTGDDDPIEFRTHSQRLARDCRLTNCAVTATGPVTHGSECRWVSIYGERNRVDLCYFAGKNDIGATLVVWVGKTPGEHRIDHNHFGPRPVLEKNGGETIRVGTSEVSLLESRTVVEDNLFEECDGEGEIISNKSCGNTYRHNVFLKCEGALTLRHGNGCLVDGNVFLGEGKLRTGGVRIIGEDHVVVNNYFEGLQGDEQRSAISFMNGMSNWKLNEYAPVQRAVVAGNTIVDCKVPLTIGVGASDKVSVPPTNCTIMGNLWLNGRRAPIVKLSEPTNWTWSGNFCRQTDNRAGFEQCLAVDIDVRRGGDGLQRPTATDSIRGVRYSLDHDIDGQPRPVPFSAGCDELSDAAPMWTIVTRAEVGPEWREKP